MDYNNDGYVDLLAGDRYGDNWLFSRNSDGTLNEEGNIWADEGPINTTYNCSPYFTDWDEDGYLDLLIGGHSSGSTSAGFHHIYLNTDANPDSPIFTTYSDLDFYTQWRTTTEVYDLDRDGRKDLVMGYEMGQVYFAQNVGTNENPEFTGYVQLESEGTPIDVGGRARETIDDWNEDGIPDLIVANTTNDKIQVFLGYDVGVAEEQSANVGSSFSLDVLGSPTRGLFSMRVNLPQPTRVAFSVYTVDGREIRSFSRNLTQGITTLPCDIGSNPPGVFYVTAKAGRSTRVDRVVLID